jgi:hypothetical protein
MVRLRICSGPDQGQVYELVDGQYRIGRDADCQIVLADGAVSRHHALLTVSGATVQIADVGSRHGTLVGEAPVTAAAVSPADTVRIGSTVFVVEPADHPTPGAPDLGRPPSPARRRVNWPRNIGIFALALILISLGACWILSSLFRGLLPGRGSSGGLGGLVVTDRGYNKIQPGMSYDDVLRICGPPLLKEPEGTAAGVEDSPEIWHYANAEIQFRDEKVVGKRRVAPNGGG